MENPRPACDLHSQRTKNEVPFHSLAVTLGGVKLVRELCSFFFALILDSPHSPSDSIKCLMLNFS